MTDATQKRQRSFYLSEELFAELSMRATLAHESKSGMVVRALRALWLAEDSAPESGAEENADNAR